MKAVIMVGGKGTRIMSMDFGVPKPMIPVEGIPILERQIGCLTAQGIDEIVLCLGFMGEIIQNHFGDGTGCSPVTGKPFGARISYLYEDKPLGTAGALYQLRGQLREDFLLLNGDILFDVNIARFSGFHDACGAQATVFTHPNDHPFDSALINTDSLHRVTGWLHREDARQWYQNRVNAGLHILHPDVLQLLTGEKTDLDRDILKPMIAHGRLFAYDSPEYVKDMGTPERYWKVCEDLRTGRVAARNLSRLQKAVFLDRDGTLNKYVGFLTRAEQLELLEGVSEAIRLINSSGYLAIVVTNQPVVARGDTTLAQLDEIHRKLETLLGERGAFLDGLYYCPHHPDGGFPGERPEYKIQCDCRKPMPGMLMRAAQDFHIDLSASWMVGDGLADMQAGERAGCRTALVGKEPYPTLLDFVKKELVV